MEDNKANLESLSAQALTQKILSGALEPTLRHRWSHSTRATSSLQWDSARLWFPLKSSEKGEQVWQAERSWGSKGTPLWQEKSRISLGCTYLPLCHPQSQSADKIKFRKLSRARLTRVQKEVGKYKKLKKPSQKKMEPGPENMIQMVLSTGFYLVLLSDCSRSIPSEGLSPTGSLPPTFSPVPGCSSLEARQFPISQTSHQSLHTHSRDGSCKQWSWNSF